MTTAKLQACQELCDMVIKYYEPAILKNLMDVILYGETYCLPDKKWTDMRYDIGDKVGVIMVGWGMVTHEEEGEVIGLDRQRQQYHVRVTGGKEFWLNQDEIKDLPASRRALSPAFTSWTSDNSMACKHEYVLYIGLMEQFNHCKKCGTKEHPDV